MVSDLHRFGSIFVLGTGIQRGPVPIRLALSFRKDETSSMCRHTSPDSSLTLVCQIPPIGLPTWVSSPTSVSRVFAQRVGMSPQAWIETSPQFHLSRIACGEAMIQRGAGSQQANQSQIGVTTA